MTLLMFKSVRFRKPQIFVEMFCTNLQSPVWSSAMLVYVHGTPTLRPENSITSGTYLRCLND